MTEPRSDAQILEMLTMRDKGMTCRAIGEVYGMTKSAVIGLLHRVDRETRPSRHDGTLPREWWREGLERR